VHIPHQEDPAAEIRHQTVQGGPVESFARGGAGQTFNHPHFVAFRLQAADKPGAGVGQAAVIEVNGVLGGQDNAQAEGTRLLQEGQHRHLGRRIGCGGEIAEDFIHVQQGPQR